MSKSSLFVKSKPSGAEAVRRRLLELGVFNGERSVLREKGYVLFPVKEEVKIKDCEITSRQSKYRKKKPKSLRVALKGKLSENEIDLLPSSFDLIGDIAVIELPDELLPKKEVVGQVLISTFKNIKVAAVKSSPVGSEYRTRSVEVVAGENRTETVHKEYGCSYKLDVSKAYFSPRSGTERKRVADQVEDGERVLVLFAGVGPFPILIAKSRSPKEVVAVELNEAACDYMLWNVAKNKVDVKVVCGDAKVETQKLGKFDRIVMPLPKDAGDFLGVALPALAPEGVVHFYTFAHDTNEAEDTVKKKAKELGYKIKLLNSVVCGSYSPCLSRICVDFTLLVK